MYYVTYDSNNQQSWKQSLIDCYKEVFASPPWNEDWWTDSLVQEVLDHYAGPNARIVLAIEDEKVVGFAWGAVWSIAELCTELDLELPKVEVNTVGYIKDIGVSEAFREHGIARDLLTELLSVIDQSCENGSYVYARTLASPEPSVVYLWFPKLGFKVLAEYPKDSERAGQVILGHSLHSSAV